MEKTAWRKSFRVLAPNLEEARQFADALLPPPPERGPTAPDSPFTHAVHRSTNDPANPLSAAQERRLVGILAQAAQEAAQRVNPSSYSKFWDYRAHLETALLKIIPKHCKTLLDAASVSDAKAKCQKEVDAIIADTKAETQAIRKEARKSLASELKNARRNLKVLTNECEIKAVMAVANSYCEEHGFQPVPTATVEATRLGEVPPRWPQYATGRVHRIGWNKRRSPGHWQTTRD